MVKGKFNLPDLKPAENYTLRVDAQKGWKQQITEPFAVGSGEKVSLALCLQPDNVYEVVGLYSEPVEIVLDGTKPTGIFVPRETYPLPTTPKETPPEPRPTRP